MPKTAKGLVLQEKGSNPSARIDPRRSSNDREPLTKENKEDSRHIDGVEACSTTSKPEVKAHGPTHTYAVISQKS